MGPVSTPRLIVCHFAETDLADLLAYQTHPETIRFLPMQPMSQERALQFLHKQANPENGDGKGYVAFAIYHPGDAKVIAEVGVFIEPEPQSKGDIGWLLHPDYQRQGYATEAAQVVLCYSFLQRNLRRVTSGCDTRNKASVRLMERLGLRREGHLRQSHLTRGVWQDEYLYALLRDEWLAGQPATNRVMSYF